MTARKSTAAKKTATKKTAAKKTTTKKTYTQDELDQILAQHTQQGVIKQPEIVAVHGFAIMEDSKVVPFSRYEPEGLVITIMSAKEFAAVQEASSSDEGS